MKTSTPHIVEIVQITDIHLGATEDFRLKGTCPAKNLSRVLAAVSQIPYDWLIATGDISDDLSPESYRLFLQILERHNISSLVCLSGNHDAPAIMQKILMPVALPQLFFDQKWLFICLNTAMENMDDGEVKESDLARLSTLLIQHTQLHVAIFMHHHVIPVESCWIDKYKLRNHTAFMNLLSRHKNVRAVISGHVHQTSRKQSNGINFYTSPATSLQFIPLSKKSEVSDASPSWRKWIFWPDGRVSDQLYSIGK